MLVQHSLRAHSNHSPAKQNTVGEPDVTNGQTIDDRRSKTAPSRGEYFVAPDKVTEPSNNTDDHRALVAPSRGEYFVAGDKVKSLSNSSGEHRVLSAPSRGEYFFSDDSAKTLNEAMAQLRKEMEDMRNKGSGKSWLKQIQLPKLEGKDTKKRD